MIGLSVALLILAVNAARFSFLISKAACNGTSTHCT